VCKRKKKKRFKQALQHESSAYNRLRYKIIKMQPTKVWKHNVYGSRRKERLK